MVAYRLEEIRSAVGGDRSSEIEPRVQSELALELLEAGLARYRQRREDGPLDLSGRCLDGEADPTVADLVRGAEIRVLLDELLLRFAVDAKHGRPPLGGGANA